MAVAATAVTATCTKRPSYYVVLYALQKQKNDTNYFPYLRSRHKAIGNAS